MPEILTESFCERCGTRYTFQAAAPTRSRLSRLKIIARGLRNYVLSDDTTLEEAFADARSDEEREISAQQLEAFHRTFNFCLSCRQYTCANCWNEAEGRCLTCAPDLSREPLPAPFPTLSTTVEPIEAAVAAGGDGDGAVWPAEDLAAKAPPMPPAQPREAAGVETTAPAADLGRPSPQAPPTAPATSPTERAAAAAEQTAALLGRFRPAPAPETSGGATPSEAPIEAGAEASAALEAAPAFRPAEPPPAEPTAVESPAAVAPAERGEASEAAAELGPPVEAIPAAAEASAAVGQPGQPAAASVPASPPTDRIAQPVWPSAPAPSTLPPPGPAWPPPPVTGRPAAGHALAAEAVWAESSRDVLAPRTGGVQACIACGLPLSATARFCRRCGSPQERA